MNGPDLALLKPAGTLWRAIGDTLEARETDPPKLCEMHCARC